MFGCYTNYIPDLTERYPEGFRTFDDYEPDSFEPEVSEETSDNTNNNNEEDSTMKNMSFAKLNEELINRGIVFEPSPTDEYETLCELHSIHENGFITATSCIVLPTNLTFYDWTGQSIISLDIDDCTYKICDGVLYVTESNTFSGNKKRIVIDLKDGAPVHVDDVAAIGYEPSDNYHDKRFYALNDGRIYYKEDGHDLKLLEGDVDVIDFQDQGFELIGPDSYQSNIDVLNEMIVRM